MSDSRDAFAGSSIRAAPTLGMQRRASHKAAHGCRSEGAEQHDAMEAQSSRSGREDVISAGSPDEHTLHTDAKRAQRQGLRAPPKFLPEWEQEYMQAEYTPGMLLGFLGVVIPFNVLMWLATYTAEYGKFPEDCWDTGGVLLERRNLIACTWTLICSLLVALVAITTPAKSYWRLHEWCCVSWVLGTYVAVLGAEVSRDYARGMLPWKAGELPSWCKQIRHINVTMARSEGSWRYHRVCHDEDPLNTLTIAPHQFAGCEFFVKTAKNTVSVCV
jgi:hypothetical protein